MVVPKLIFDIYGDPSLQVGILPFVLRCVGSSPKSRLSIPSLFCLGIHSEIGSNRTNTDNNRDSILIQ